MKAKTSIKGMIMLALVMVVLSCGVPTMEYYEHKSIMEDRVINSKMCGLYCRGEK